MSLKTRFKEVAEMNHGLGCTLDRRRNEETIEISRLFGKGKVILENLKHEKIQLSYLREYCQHVMIRATLSAG